MYNYFSSSRGNNLIEVFGMFHIFLLVASLCIALLFFLFRKKLKINKHIKKIIAIILLLNMVIWYGGYIMTGTWTYKFHLPLHLCFILNFLYIYALLFDKKEMYNYLFYMIGMSSISGIVWMADNLSFEKYITIQYIISHHFMLLSVYYLFFVLKEKVNIVGLKKAIILMNIIFISVLAFNLLFGTEYIFVKSFPPQIYKLYPFLKGFGLGFRIILLEAVGLLIGVANYTFIVKKVK